jgi:hypothetical protein
MDTRMGELLISHSSPLLPDGEKYDGLSADNGLMPPPAKIRHAFAECNDDIVSNSSRRRELDECFLKPSPLIRRSNSGKSGSAKAEGCTGARKVPRAKLGQRKPRKALEK